MLVVLIKTQGSDRTPSLLLFQFRQSANDTRRVRVGGLEEGEREGREWGKLWRKTKGTDSPEGFNNNLALAQCIIRSLGGWGMG